jgi:hypothetical protein
MRWNALAAAEKDVLMAETRVKHRHMEECVRAADQLEGRR